MLCFGFEIKFFELTDISPSVVFSYFAFACSNPVTLDSSMGASSIAYPPWISAACEKDHPVNFSMFQSAKRLGHLALRKKLISKYSNSNGAYSASNLLSSFCSFEPCNECYHSKGLYKCLSIFGENAFTTRRRINRLMNCDAHSGNCIFHLCHDSVYMIYVIIQTYIYYIDVVYSYVFLYVCMLYDFVLDMMLKVEFLEVLTI